MKTTHTSIRECTLKKLKEISKKRKKKYEPNRYQMDILEELVTKAHRKECKPK